MAATSPQDHDGRPRGPVRGPAPPVRGRATVVPARVTPVRRLLSLAIAAFAVLVGVGLVFGAHTAGPGLARLPYAILVFGVQVLFVLAFTMTLRPPGLAVVAVVGLAAAGAGDVVATAAEPGLAPLGYVAAGAFMVGVIGQLLRREGRLRVTESLGATLVIVVGVIAYASLIVLTRLVPGTQVILVCLTAAGVAMAVARLVDMLAPWPRPSPQVPRGALGVVLGAMLGTLAAAFLGSVVPGFTPTGAAMVGVVGAVAAVLADLSVGYAEAGRRIVGEAPTMWLARHLQGPLAGFAVAAPLAYLISALFYVDNYF